MSDPEPYLVVVCSSVCDYEILSIVMDKNMHEIDLRKINSPADLKDKSVDQLTTIAAEMRKTLIEKLAVHGGINACAPLPLRELLFATVR